LNDAFLGLLADIPEADQRSDLLFLGAQYSRDQRLTVRWNGHEIGGISIDVTVEVPQDPAFVNVPEGDEVTMPITGADTDERLAVGEESPGAGFIGRPDFVEAFAGRGVPELQSSAARGPG
jgi:hypothetical protein